MFNSTCINLVGYVYVFDFVFVLRKGKNYCFIMAEFILSYTITFQRQSSFGNCHDSYYFTPVIINSITCLVHPCLLELVKQLLRFDWFN